MFHLQISSQQRLGLQHKNLGGCKCSVHNGVLACRLSHPWPTFEILISFLIRNATSSHITGAPSSHLPCLTGETQHHNLLPLAYDKPTRLASLLRTLTPGPCQPSCLDALSRPHFGALTFLSGTLTKHPLLLLSRQWPFEIESFPLSNFKFLWIAPEMAPTDSGNRAF